jgi:hypothetical protein
MTTGALLLLRMGSSRHHYYQRCRHLALWCRRSGGEAVPKQLRRLFSVWCAPPVRAAVAGRLDAREAGTKIGSMFVCICHGALLKRLGGGSMLAHRCYC